MKGSRTEVCSRERRASFGGIVGAGGGFTLPISVVFCIYLVCCGPGHSAGHCNGLGRRRRVCDPPPR